MENGLLDRVEGNANVHRWSEQTQLGKGDSITARYVSELSDYTRISVTQNNLQKLKVDENLFRALAQIYSRAACVPTFGKKLMTITGMSEQWIMARIKEKGESKCIPWRALKDLIQTHPDEAKRIDMFALSIYGLMVFPRALGYVYEATTGLFHRLSKWVTSVPAILAETFRSLNACRRASTGKFVGCAQLLLAWFYSHFRLIDRVVCRVFFEDYSTLKDIAASTRRVNVPEENWIVLLQNLQSKDVEWRAPWMIPGEILYRYSSFDWVPLLGMWGAIGYAPLLVLRQHGLRQFVPATHGLAQSEFLYRGADYKKKVSEISSGWSQTCRLKGVAINLATTPEYIEWKSRRSNDNIPRPSMEGARPMKEYLQVMPSKLEIMKQEFKRKNLELEKKIAKLEEEKMYLSLDIDVQKIDIEKERKGKRKIEEDRDDLKEHYKRAQVALKRAGIGRFSDPGQKEGELHQSRGQVRERDHVIGEAVAQIREVAEHVQALTIRADVLSLMYESSLDKGQELALLLDRVKTVGIRAKAYL
ncbi:hypothetical protein CXB51_009952 [Gossypium anomalum]|uniref:DUF7745 domain-containing protein n=1 Tax=Gossypium anomalum TaxID=47600 RepID=A0A8J5YZL4_9ROSI|nr:hypothetical protein CXB51_009952 [Gossypium anomalum]